MTDTPAAVTDAIIDTPVEATSSEVQELADVAHQSAESHEESASNLSESQGDHWDAAAHQEQHARENQTIAEAIGRLERLIDERLPAKVETGVEELGETGAEIENVPAESGEAVEETVEEHKRRRRIFGKGRNL